MTRRLVVTYLVITAFGLALLAVPLGITFAHREKDRLLFDVERDADTMSALVEDALESGARVPSNDIMRYARSTGGHVIVVNAQGVALLDTQPGRDPDYSRNRPEITAALHGRRVQGTRRSTTLDQTLVYAAVPTTSRGHVNGAVRITYPTTTLDRRVRRVWVQLTLLCLSILAAVAAVGFLLARSITRPVRRLELATERIASGDLSARVDASGPPELRHLAATFNRMAGRLAGLLDAQQRFVADASHQLRTPLTALRLRLENLEADIDARDHTSIEAAAAEVEHMSRLVDGLLVLARDDASRAALVAVDVAAVARDRAEVWQDVGATRAISVRVDAPPSAWARAVDTAAEQLLDNLVDNALAVAPDESVITIRVTTRGLWVELHVLDDGPGLDADARERAFDRFWRAPGARPGGTGLGLAIARRLAEASGGSTRLDARPEGGLDAVVVLPATAAPASIGAAPVLAGP